MDSERRRNLPSLPRYLDAVEGGGEPPAEIEQLTPAERMTERLMLGLRLDQPLELGGVEDALDRPAAERLATAGLVELQDGTIRLSERGRYVANSVLASILR